MERCEIWFSLLPTGLLGTPKEAIEKALTVRVVSAKREVMEVKANLSKAIYARDALAKVIIICSGMKLKVAQEILGQK